jgi:hypothetical protein
VGEIVAGDTDVGNGVELGLGVGTATGGRGVSLRKRVHSACILYCWPEVKIF